MVSVANMEVNGFDDSPAPSLPPVPRAAVCNPELRPSCGSDGLTVVAYYSVNLRALLKCLSNGGVLFETH